MKIHALKDEVEGVGEYRHAIGTCKNAELSVIFEMSLASEKEHASMLLKWINKNATSFLR